MLPELVRLDFGIGGSLVGNGDEVIGVLIQWISSIKPSMSCIIFAKGQ